MELAAVCPINHYIGACRAPRIHIRHSKLNWTSRFHIFSSTAYNPCYHTAVDCQDMTRQISSASVPGRNNPCVLEHQDNGALRCSRSVKYAFWYNESLTWRELHDALFQIDKQLAFDDVEELVIVVMFVPVVLALDHSNSHYGRVYLAERLVIPLMRSCVGKRLLVD